jgi:hypothetical protein
MLMKVGPHYRRPDLRLLGFPGFPAPSKKALGSAKVAVKHDDHRLSVGAVLYTHVLYHDVVCRALRNLATMFATLGPTRAVG